MFIFQIQAWLVIEMKNPSANVNNRGGDKDFRGLKYKRNS